MAGWYGLCRLDLSGCAAISSLAPLASIFALTMFRLRHCSRAAVEDVARNYGRLRALDLIRADVRGAALAAVSAPTALTSLSACSCSSLSDDELGHIGRATGIAELQLAGCTSVTDARLVHLSEKLGSRGWASRIADATRQSRDETAAPSAKLRACPG